jgi:serine/threonine protein kinase
MNQTNVHIDDERTAVLCNFGLSNMKADIARQTATHKLTNLGSQNWLSPEQLMGGLPGKPSDIFALGMTIFEVRLIFHSTFYGVSYNDRFTPMKFLWDISIQETSPYLLSRGTCGLNILLKTKHLNWQTRCGALLTNAGSRIPQWGWTPMLYVIPFGAYATSRRRIHPHQRHIYLHPPRL